MLSIAGKQQDQYYYYDFDFALETIRCAEHITQGARNDYVKRIGVFTNWSQTFSGRDHDVFAAFKNWLSFQNTWSDATKNKYLTTARVYLRELHRNSIITTDYTLNVKSFAIARGHKRLGHSQDDINRICEYFLNQEEDADATYWRKRAMFNLFIFEGLRQQEVVNIQCCDIDWTNKAVNLTRKGGKKVLKQVNPRTIKALRKYADISGIKSGPFFVGFGNRNKMKTAITTRHIKRDFAKIFEDCGIDNKTVHRFRHYYITTILNATNDLRLAQKAADHSSIETTMIYDDEMQFSEKLKSVYAAFESVNI